MQTFFFILLLLCDAKKNDKKETTKTIRSIYSLIVHFPENKIVYINALGAIQSNLKLQNTNHIGGERLNKKKSAFQPQTYMSWDFIIIHIRCRNFSNINQVMYKFRTDGRWRSEKRSTFS